MVTGGATVRTRGETNFTDNYAVQDGGVCLVVIPCCCLL